MSEQKVIGIEEAHKTNKNRGGTITVAEKYAIDVVGGKTQASAQERAMSVKYLLELDLLRKKQRFASVNERRKKRHEDKVEENKAESQITPELAKRLAQLEGK